MEVFAGVFVEGVVVVVGLLPTALKNQFVRFDLLAYALIGSHWLSRTRSESISPSSKSIFDFKITKTKQRRGGINVKRLLIQ